MRATTKFAAVAVAAAALATFAAPANATIYIGLQNANAAGGVLTQVATGGNFASYANTWGDFELTFTSGAQGVLPIILGSTSHVQNNANSGGTLEVYVTRTGISGPVPLGFRSSFTVNTLTAGWNVTERTYYNVGNAVFNTSNLLSSKLFNPPGPATFVHYNGTGAENAEYSVTQRYTIVASNAGQAESTISMAAIPEPGTWALMILGFGGAGAMLRRGRRSSLLTA